MQKLIFLICSILLVSTAYAQNKVVVIPMGSANSTANNIYGGATIAPDGTIFSSFGKPFTVTPQSPGGYNIHLAGLRPGCTDPWPMILVTCWGAGFCYPVGMGTNCLTGDTSIFVNTYNAAGIAVDMAFTHLLTLPDAPLTPAAAPMAAKPPEVCELDTATGVETCR